MKFLLVALLVAYAYADENNYKTCGLQEKLKKMIDEDPIYLVTMKECLRESGQWESHEELYDKWMKAILEWQSQWKTYECSKKSCSDEELTDIYNRVKQLQEYEVVLNDLKLNFESLNENVIGVQKVIEECG